ncbi:flagellar basal body P-ring formation chaperone FlgA [Salinarimonas soli]|uniref:Flagellar basal body P-ring formation protein FlgA n=1 Tax=Salinarimonas soli TaxID=1638099 RepID=A0A5B2V7U0_9HYPH|nr:flagellar basal body P-ring formation chaperone FlgA [Salinarimonas soli]KAA2234828.1 flagellar basal body P-ring formation protein FlgA [Salinarimonas soli]
MIIEPTIPALRRRHPAGRHGLSGGVVLRVALAVAFVCLAALPVLAGTLALRPEIAARGDVVTLGDLVEGAPEALAGTPVFRAPALGESGTIQAARILEAAARHGLRAVETRGLTQVAVRRAGRRVDVAEVEAAVKAALELRHQVDARTLGVLFDGAAPPVPAVADDAALVAEDVTFDPRTRRFTARIALRGTEGRMLARVAGQAIEMAEVQVLQRGFNRGDTLQAGDVAVERRPRASVPGDALVDGNEVAGRSARRTLAAGSILRNGDLQRPEIVARGEIVTIVYEVPGLVLTLRGRANEAGAKGDVVSVTNPQSKRTLQATVVAPGKVSVQAATPGPVAQRP